MLKRVYVVDYHEFEGLEIHLKHLFDASYNIQEIGHVSGEGYVGIVTNSETNPENLGQLVDMVRAECDQD